jgi:hypothetical protein
MIRWVAGTMAVIAIVLAWLPTSAKADGFDWYDKEPCHIDTTAGIIACTEGIRLTGTLVSKNEMIPGTSLSEAFYTVSQHRDGAGLSYGFVQFTEASGHLGKVLKMAIDLSPSSARNFRKDLYYVLHRLNKSKSRKEIKRMKSILTNTRSRYLELAQWQVFNDAFYLPFRDAAWKHGIYDDESVSQVIDHAVNAGRQGAFDLLVSLPKGAKYHQVVSARKAKYRSFRSFKRYGETWLRRIDAISTGYGYNKMGYKPHPRR